HLVEGHVADEAAPAIGGRHALDANVDDGGAGLDPVPAYHLGPTDRRHHEVGAANNARQVTRARMGNRHGAILIEEELRNRLADDVGAADHNGLQAREVAAYGLG